MPELADVAEGAANEHSDEKLLEYHKHGDGQAFTKLVKRYQRELYNYLRKYTGDATLAEDVSQNTFLRIHLRLDLFKPGRRFRPWLYAIATHQAVDTLRKAGRRPTVSLDAKAPSRDGESDTFAELFEGAEPDPSKESEERERRQWVRDALEKLPPHLALTVYLAYYQGLKYREIAELLAIPIGTVKTRLHDAVLRLREQYKKKFEEAA